MQQKFWTSVHFSKHLFSLIKILWIYLTPLTNSNHYNKLTPDLRTQIFISWQMLFSDKAPKTFKIDSWEKKNWLNKMELTVLTVAECLVTIFYLIKSRKEIIKMKKKAIMFLKMIFLQTKSLTWLEGVLFLGFSTFRKKHSKITL